MKKILLWLPLLLPLMASVLSVMPVSGQAGFLSTIGNNNTSKQKTLVILYRNGCPYCEQMNHIISSDQPLQEILTTSFRIYTLDIDSSEGQNFASQFGIHAVPTIINFNNQTGGYHIIKGFGSRQRFLKELSTEAGFQQASYTTGLAAGVVLAAACGNGVIEAGEQCDDGNVTNGDGCTSTCTVQPGYQCTGNPSVCIPFEICGNGILEPGEQCDDGNVANGDGCTNTCTVQPGYQCVGTPSACTPIQFCGNGIVEAGEQCDDGNTANGDGCTNTCTVQPGYQCSGTPSACIPLQVCGNGIVESGEQCDDGNTANGDGCTNTCTVQPGYQCSGTPSACTAIEMCGNGIVEAGEQCDDGNIANGDGCTATCLIQPGYQCSGTPSACILLPVCGNGKLEPGEQCDDGNTADADGCSASCMLENGDGAILIKQGNGTADYSAMLDVSSTQRGILIPRMTTTQRTAITAPATGLMVFDASTNSFWYFGGAAWKEIRSDLSNAGFSASIQSVAQNTTPGSPAFVSFPVTDFEDGGTNYNSGTSSYVVPASGVYEFSASVSININSSPAASSSYSINLYEAAGFTTHAIGSSTMVIPAGYTGNITLSATGTVKLAAGTGGLVRVTVTASANTTAQPIAAGKFSGHRVY